MNRVYKLLFFILLILSLILGYILYLNAPIIQLKILTLKTEKKQKEYKSDYEEKKKKRDNTRYYITDIKGNKLNNDFYKSVSKLTPDRLKVKKRGKYGIIDNTGKYILPLKYYKIEYKRDKNIFFAQIKKDEEKGSSQSNLIDIIFDYDGNKKLEADEIDIYSDYVVFGGENNKYIISDSNYKKIFEIISEYNPVIVDSNYFKIKQSGRYKLVDNKGREVLPLLYDNISRFYKKDNKVLFEVKNNYQYGVIDNHNKIICPLVFEDVRLKYNKDNSVIMAKNNNKYAFFDLDGNFLDYKNLPYEEWVYKKSYSYGSKYEDGGYGNPKRLILKEEEEKPSEKTHKEKTENIEPEFYTLEEIKKFEKKSNILFIGKIQDGKYVTFIVPPIPKGKVSDYISDFNSPLKKGNYTKLTCSEKTQIQFCKLSPNGLSAKYCGHQNFYTASKSHTKGKYYFEFQIKDTKSIEKISLDNGDKFGFIYFHKEPARMYDWKMSPSVIEELRRYDIKTGDIVGVSLDLDNARAKISVNGIFKDKDPYSKKSGIKLYENKEYYPAFSISGYSEILTVNFGSQKFKYQMLEGYKPFNGKEI